MYNYIIREIKNIFEFYLVPLLVVLLPLKIYFFLFRTLCRYTSLYSKYSDGSFEIALQYIDKINEKKTWEVNVKLLYLVDISDYWLARFRPKKMLKQLYVTGDWIGDKEKSKSNLLLGAHFGPGYSTLIDLRSKGFFPYFVYAEPLVEFKFQSFVEKHYRKIRVKHINKISGASAISTGGGYNKIKKVVSDGGSPIILFDAPQFNKKSNFSLKIFDRKYKIASGFVNLICNEKIEFQLYCSKLDYRSGNKKLLICKSQGCKSINLLIDRLSIYFEELILSSPEQWYFWRQSKGLLEEC